MSDQNESKQVPGAVDLPSGAQIDTGVKVDMIWEAKIPMRDGVHLNATIFKPQEMPKPLPVIFTLTPYIGDSYQDRAAWFARNGYIYALVDVRGRGNSGGEFEPVINEGRDGHDAVEWLAQQDWCDGQVTMWGGSYAGYDQWATLINFPEHLSTIVPVASGYPSHDFPFPKNIFGTYFMQWLTFTSGLTPNVNLFSDAPFWGQKFLEMYLDHRPFKDLPQIVGNHSTCFQTWLDHSKRDSYWDQALPTEEDYARIDQPILTITGHYDGDQNGAMDFYKEHMQFGNAEAKAQHYLIIGPWDHAGTRTPQKSIGGMTFGDASMLDMNKLHKEWYDWTMKDGKKPEFLKKRVAYYVMGTDEWKFVDTLEEVPTSMQRYYLDSRNAQANDVFQSGCLNNEVSQAEAPDAYVYDPLDTRPAELAAKPNPNYITDQTSPCNLFDNGLVYHTAPFEKDIEVSGYIKLSTWIEMDVPDTDFIATLYEIKPDGSSMQLTQDLIRARYRESLREEKLIVPGEINEYVFDWFTFFSSQIAKGSRLRLLIECPNTPMLQKNYNSGGVVFEESGKDARTAHIKLYHNAQYPSYLEIPIVE